MKIKINNILKKINLDKTNVKEVESQKRRKHVLIKNKKGNILELIKIGFINKRSYNLLLISMIILAVVSIYTNIITYKKINDEKYIVFNNKEEEILPPASSVFSEIQDEITNNVDVRNKSEIKENIVNTTKASAPKIEPLVFAKPLNGEIIKHFSMEKLLYSNTLESWKTHDGIDIKSNLGTNVMSIEKGLIERIYNDSFLGTTIIIDHGQGYKSIYSNLEKNVLVKEKQTVEKSKVIAKVGQTAIGEIKDEPHIHFMIMFNNKVIDPTSKIRF